MANEKPILFSGPLVRAILESRKTQTRRVVKRQPDAPYPAGGWHGLPPVCPYGQAGDRLWVRETFQVMWKGDDPCYCEPHPTGLCADHELIEYRADTGTANPGEWPKEFRGDPECPRWKPSIHMPRWASRIDLEVTGVRVERVQEITPNDARAEGVDESPWKGRPTPAPYETSWGVPAFSGLWDTINGKRDGCSWAANPWVWVVNFRRINA